MTPLTSDKHPRPPDHGRCRRLAVALLRVAGSASAQPGAAASSLLGADLALNAMPGTDPGPAVGRWRETPAATSGNFLLRKGVFSPLADNTESNGRTVYNAIDNRGWTVGTYDAGAG